MSTPDTSEDLTALAERAIKLVEQWLEAASRAETATERRSTRRLARIVKDPEAVRFGMGFVDRVIRPEDDRIAAAQLNELVKSQSLPGFLSILDRALLGAGARLGMLLPGLVMPLARRRMRSLVGHLLVDAQSDVMSAHLSRRRGEGFRLNVNLLGEAVLGDREARRRHQGAMRLLSTPEVDYVSVKVSAVVAQLNYWDFEGSVARVVETLRPLFEQARVTSPPTFVNLDMEEYHDLELTLEAFKELLTEPALVGIDAGVVLQAYLPDSFDALRDLCEWANARARRCDDSEEAGLVKVRLVKGANLAMERVDAAMHGWQQAPYRTKAETDANYKRCLDWLFHSHRLRSMRVGVASHNLFDLAFAKLLANQRGVTDRIEFEMLEGMAPTHARLLRTEDTGMLLYTPVVAASEFDVAISYLFRRLEENASAENFIHHLFTMQPHGPHCRLEADRFRKAVCDRWKVGSSPNRVQNRGNSSPQASLQGFENSADTDPVLAANRSWMANAIEVPDTVTRVRRVDDSARVDAIVEAARSAQARWRAEPPALRRELLYAVAERFERRRGELISCMVHEARKVVAEADSEVSEAVDFARYYGERALDLVDAHADFEPWGVVLVAPPWNFPVAIAAGGTLASLAAGNAVILKPAPEVPRCAEILAECCWEAGVPADLLQFVPVPENDTGRYLVTHDGVDALILTGAYETAELFRSWDPNLRIFAETSGKNALIITPNADLDLAVADLAASAFGHTGQKCSAASLAILVGDVYDSERFRRQLIDVTESLRVGPASDLATMMGPTIKVPTSKLMRALTQLDHPESWLVEPHRTTDGLWTPGIREGVQAGSWFYHTECFGPVVGLMRAETLSHALALQNGTGFGLTGGIHSLDRKEIEHWLAKVEVGNAYVNRATTGAIVQRQPFGGWKRSSIGPGAKAGGPNYVAQLGRWVPTDLDERDEAWLASAMETDAAAWGTEFAVEHDPAALFCESNRFRYRPIESLAVRVEEPGHRLETRRVIAAAERCGVAPVVSTLDNQSPSQFAESLRETKPDRIRLIGPVSHVIRTAANELGIDIADAPVVANGRIELMHYLREQAISETIHRYGNLI